MLLLEATSDINADLKSQCLGGGELQCASLRQDYRLEALQLS